MPNQKSQIEDKIMDTFTLGEDYVNIMRMQYPWVERAISNPLRTNENQSVYTAVEFDEKLKQWMVFPTIRRDRDDKGNPINKLKEYDRWSAMDIAKERNDYIPVESKDIGNLISHGFSKYLGNK